MATAPPIGVPLPPEIQALLEAKPSTEVLVAGRAGGELHVGMLLKRTYRVDGAGRCELAGPDEQHLVVKHFVLAHDLPAPLVAPVLLDDDTAAFRNATDLVVQGSAQSYGRTIDRTTVAVSCGDFRREIRVYGDRRAEWKDGRLRFSLPAPFETMSIGYGRAYGGYDSVALRAWSDPQFEAMKQGRPEYDLGRATPFHYPRNPSGRGFLVEATRESVSEVLVPNLEFPFDPITPERLAVGSPERWLRGPLPASMDWTRPDWFPRCAYLGVSGVAPDAALPVAEIDLGWAPPDLLESPSAIEHPDAMRPEVAQGASPGLSLPYLDPAAELLIENLHPEQPTWRVRLPGEVPDARLELGGPVLTPLAPHLNSVLVQPSAGLVVTTWCAHAAAQREPGPLEADELAREVRWSRTSGGG